MNEPFKTLKNLSTHSNSNLAELQQLSDEQYIAYDSNYQSNKSATGTKKKGKGIQWNDEENNMYLAFLIKYQDCFEYSKKELKELKIHEIMSKQVVTRKAKQCRSHHQKMLKKYGTVQKIIFHLKKILKKRQKVEKSAKLINYVQMEKYEKEDSMWNTMLKQPGGRTVI